MDGFLGVVSPYLGPSIVSPEALARIRAVARLLPPCALAGFELRLSDDQSRVDFAVRLPNGNPALGVPLVSDPTWQHVLGLCEQTANPSGMLHQHVTQVLLEFDLDAPPAAIPIPGVFLTLAPNQVHTTDTLERLFRRLHLDEPTHPSLDCLLRCHTALPPGAGIGQIGLMFSRPAHGLRVVVRGLSVATLFPYLEGIAWSERAPGLLRLLASIAPQADPAVLLDIDVAETVLPGVGVEFYVRSGTNDALRWRVLFAYLAARGLASPQKVDAILAWPGVSQRGQVDSQWPADLALGDALVGGSAASVFWRSINHIKVSYAPDREPEVKAYLVFGHRWIPTGAAASA